MHTKPSTGGSSGSALPGDSVPGHSGAYSHGRSGNKSVDDTSKRNGGPDFRLSKTKREWSRLNGDVQLRNDDEAKLTNDITGSPSLRTASDEEGTTYQMSTIRVKRNVSWSSAHMDDSVP